MQMGKYLQIPDTVNGDIFHMYSWCHSNHRNCQNEIFVLCQWGMHEQPAELIILFGKITRSIENIDLLHPPAAAEVRDQTTILSQS